MAWVACASGNAPMTHWTRATGFAASLFQGRPCVFQQDDAKLPSSCITAAQLCSRRVQALNWPAVKTCPLKIYGVSCNEKRRTRTIELLKFCIRREHSTSLPNIYRELVMERRGKRISVLRVLKCITGITFNEQENNLNFNFWFIVLVLLSVFNAQLHHLQVITLFMLTFHSVPRFWKQVVHEWERNLSSCAEVVSCLCCMFWKSGWIILCIAECGTERVKLRSTPVKHAPVQL